MAIQLYFHNFYKIVEEMKLHFITNTYTAPKKDDTEMINCFSGIEYELIASITPSKIFSAPGNISKGL